MSLWDGTRWVPDGATPKAPRRRIGARVLGASTEAGLITLLIFGLIAGTTFAAKGGNGDKPLQAAVGTCVVDGNVVSSTSLPTDEIINFMVTDQSGTTGWALGFTLEGWWEVGVPDRSGPTTYEFVSRTSGKDGTKYTVFDRCTAS